MSSSKHIVCPHCDAVNRVPATKDAGKGRCGECHRDLFEGQPLPLDEERFYRHADRSDVPLLVDFWAPWCGPCKMMGPEFEAAAADLEPKFRLVKVNTEEARNLAARFGIQSIPTIAIFKRGVEVARTAGAMSRDSLKAWALSNQQ